MAFNFNWSPLIADTERVRDMLTNSLNKSPKPPIIVDDIVVNELNLGSTPPDLEILEIGDLAEDRFRGIFKMSYAGDAYLTLKTRVQANPLNTYLSTKPSFASPQPLAASSGLTIPIQLTLSDIRLSGFVILVFSKQKGITLVFRNDPLDSLKVSSTFDSIPFVRDYLQKTIENQLRVLFMEDLPAIIHRLSLRFFSPDYEPAKDEGLMGEMLDGQTPLDPFASPAQHGVETADGVTPPFFDSPSETYASFSQKNLLRLAALTESQRTLSLFTPSMRDTVYRAWASAADRNEMSDGTSTPFYRPPNLSRIQSALGTQYAGLILPSQSSEPASQSTRPTLSSFQSAPTLYTLGSGRPRSHAGRRRKNRIVDLRREKGDQNASDVASVSSGYPESASRSQSGSTGTNLAGKEPTSTSQAREGEITTPPRSPRRRVGFQSATPHTSTAGESPVQFQPATPKTRHPSHLQEDSDPTPRASLALPVEKEKRPRRQHMPRMQSLPGRPKPQLPHSAADLRMLNLVSASAEGSTGGILEQAWMMKMATEIAKKVAEEKAKQGTWRPASDDSFGPRGEAPPAYVS